MNFQTFANDMRGLLKSKDPVVKAFVCAWLPQVARIADSPLSSIINDCIEQRIRDAGVWELFVKTERQDKEQFVALLTNIDETLVSHIKNTILDHSDVEVVIKDII